MKKYLVISSYARKDGDDGGELISSPTFHGSFNTINEALKMVKVEIDATIDSEVGSYEGDEEDETINDLRKSYDNVVYDVQTIKNGFKRFNSVEAGYVSYVDGLNYNSVKEVYEIVENEEDAVLNKKEEEKFKGLIQDFYESYNYETEVKEVKGSVAILAKDLDYDNEDFYVGNTWKEIFEDNLLDEILCKINDEGEDEVADMIGKKLVNFCLKYKKAK